MTLAIPPAWQTNPEPSGDPDLVFDLQSGDAEILIYLEDRRGRSLDGLFMALCYAVVIDWGGSILSRGNRAVDGLTMRTLEFQARDPDQGVRRYLRLLGVRGTQKLTVQCSAPPESFPQAQRGLRSLLESLHWKGDEPPSSPEGV